MLIEITEDELKSLLVLMMCSDPWPPHEYQQKVDIENFLDRVAQNTYGLSDWIALYHRED